MLRAVFPAALLVLFVAQPPAVDDGRKLFHDPTLGRHGVACATCHATEAREDEDGDGLVRAGHTMASVARRPHWRGDLKRAQHRDLLSAVNVCVQTFQGARPLEGTKGEALVRYLRTLGPKKKRKTPALVLEPALEANLDYDRPQYVSGNAESGRPLFYRTCHSCHPHGRSGLGPALVGATRVAVAAKVREGNGLLRGARRGTEWMPFYGRDRLSDAEVADIAAFVGTIARE